MKTLFRNGSIHTMNGTEVVHSLLVEDGRILDVNCDVPAGECQVVDLHGKTVLPGFHDSHEHFLCYATDKEKINFFGIRSLEESGRAHPPVHRRPRHQKGRMDPGRRLERK